MLNFETLKSMPNTLHLVKPKVKINLKLKKKEDMWSMLINVSFNEMLIHLDGEVKSII